jgi:hypothetical protein
MTEMGVCVHLAQQDRASAPDDCTMALVRIWRTVVSSLFVLSVTLVMAPTFTDIQAAQAAQATSTTRFGTLVTAPGSAQVEESAGLHDAMMELDWSKYEPSPGVFSVTYATQMKTWLAQLKTAGMSVTLGLGMHYTPSWIYALSDSRYVDQYGASSPDANLVFNQALRVQADSYLARVGHDLGFGNFTAIRLTSGGNAEMLFPAGGTYWAFDEGGQNGADMPPTMARNPYPGWRPGTAGLTTAQTDKWLTWYVSALDNVTSWQMTTLGGFGFHGTFELVTPGSGVRPDGATYLDQHELPDGVAGVGAVWDRFYAGLAGKRNIEAYVSSVADGSGSNDSCTTSDDSIALSSPAADSWSATRWLSRIADGLGMAKGGENPGYSSASAAYYANGTASGMMATGIRQAVSCGFADFYWAHDYTIWDGVTSLTRYISDLSMSVRLEPAR